MNLELLVKVAWEYKIMRREIKERDDKEKARRPFLEAIARKALTMMHPLSDSK